MSLVWVQVQIFDLCLVRKPGKRKEGKENWWWKDDVQEALTIKKKAFKRWSDQRDEQSKMVYKEAKRRARRIVAKARQERYQKLYDMLTKEGQKAAFQIAKQRDRASKDVQMIKAVKMIKE